MITAKKIVNAVGGKTARPCDSCLHKRARWYCAADDAFLCQGCDASVHSANQLASRHERVRLGSASAFKETAGSGLVEDSFTPSWHQGFTRKARTPRHTKPVSAQPPKGEEIFSNSNFPLVPEIGSEEASLDENEEQLLYRVPIFDPFDSELCNISNEAEKTVADERNHTAAADDDESKILLTDKGHDGTLDLDNLPGFLPSDMDLAEFAADVESLLGRGLDEDSCDIKGLGLLDCKQEDTIDVCFGSKRVKVEEEEQEMEVALECQLDPRLETLDWNFDYESPVTGEEEEEAKVVVVAAETSMMSSGCKGQMRTKIDLRLNHEAVITAWASQGCPWTTGIRPEFNLDDCWPDFMVLSLSLSLFFFLLFLFDQIPVSHKTKQPIERLKEY